MRAFVLGSVVIALMMIAYGVLGSRENDTRSGDSEHEATGIAESGTPVSTMPESNGDDGDAHNMPDPADDDEHCFAGNADADTAVSGRTVIIDPGHGGEDLGTVSPHNDLTESELVLPISEMLRDRLVESGAHVCLTRVDDTYVELAQRAYFANERDGDAFLSMHLNSLPNPDENYTMTMWGREAKDRFLAEQIVEPLRHGMAEPETLSGEPNPMSSDVYRVESLDSYMLQAAEMPAVLVEASFLSATWEARAFQDGIEDGSRWREHQIADLLHEGVLNYFEVFQ